MVQMLQAQINIRNGHPYTKQIFACTPESGQNVRRGGRPTRSNQAQHRPRRPYLIAYASCSLRRRGCLEGCLAAAVAALEAGISGSLKSFRCDATIPSKSAGWHVTVSSLASKDPITLSVHTHEHAHICLCYENA